MGASLDPRSPIQNDANSKQHRIMQIDSLLSYNFSCYSILMWMAMLFNMAILLVVVIVAVTPEIRHELHMDPHWLVFILCGGFIMGCIGIMGYMSGITGLSKRSSKKTKMFQYYIKARAVLELITLLGGIIPGLISLGFLYIMHSMAEKVLKLCEEREQLIFRPNEVVQA